MANIAYHPKSLMHPNHGLHHIINKNQIPTKIVNTYILCLLYHFKHLSKALGKPYKQSRSIYNSLHSTIETNYAPFKLLVEGKS